ncbi:MAG TPA: YicC family protein [Victivallales bacterium]|nr:YicC family protein [Victivallales bacterium]
MKSMTGYGAAEKICKSGFCICAEAFSVNRKNLEIKINLPEDLLRLESPLRKIVSSRISRGMLTLRISRKTSPSAKSDFGSGLSKKLESVWKTLERLRKKLKIKTEITISDLIASSEIISENLIEDSKEIEKIVSAATSAAIDKLTDMRQKEGEGLCKDLKARLKILSELTSEIEKKCENSSKQRRDLLLSRLEDMGLSISADDERVAKEIAIYAEKCDVSEEITRIRSHLAQFDDSLNSREPVGKNLDFLAQELQREIGTLSAKTTSHGISHLTISFKSELEKIREQIQNIE